MTPKPIPPSEPPPPSPEFLQETRPHPAEPTPPPPQPEALPTLPRPEGERRLDPKPYARQWLIIHLPTHTHEQLDSLAALLDAYAAKKAR